jgi:hypothetical protein
MHTVGVDCAQTPCLFKDRLNRQAGSHSVIWTNNFRGFSAPTPMGNRRATQYNSPLTAARFSLLKLSSLDLEKCAIPISPTFLKRGSACCANFSNGGNLEANIPDLGPDQPPPRA